MNVFVERELARLQFGPLARRQGRSLRQDSPTLLSDMLPHNSPLDVTDETAVFIRRVRGAPAPASTGRVHSTRRRVSAEPETSGPSGPSGPSGCPLFCEMVIFNCDAPGTVDDDDLRANVEVGNLWPPLMLGSLDGPALIAGTPRNAEVRQQRRVELWQQATHVDDAFMFLFCVYACTHRQDDVYRGMVMREGGLMSVEVRRSEPTSLITPEGEMTWYDTTIRFMTPSAQAVSAAVLLASVHPRKKQATRQFIRSLGVTPAIRKR